MMPLHRVATYLIILSAACAALALPALAQTAAQPASTALRVDRHADAPAKEASAAPNAIPFKQEKQSTDTLAYQSLAALVLVGLAAYGIVFGLKRAGGIKGGLLGKSRRARTLDAIRLGRRSMLYVVEYRGQELLLAESEHGVQLLVSTTATPQAGEPSSTSNQGAVDA